MRELDNKDKQRAGIGSDDLATSFYTMTLLDHPRFRQSQASIGNSNDSLMHICCIPCTHTSTATQVSVFYHLRVYPFCRGITCASPHSLLDIRAANPESKERNGPFSVRISLSCHRWLTLRSDEVYQRRGLG